MCEALTFLLNNIYIRFGTKLFRQIVGIPMDTNCAPRVADLFLFCYERCFMMSFFLKKSNLKLLKLSTQRLDIWTIYQILTMDLISQIYPSELQLNKGNSSETEATFFGFSFVYFKWVYFMQNL